MAREITEDNYKKLISRISNIVIIAFIVGGIVGWVAGYITASNNNTVSAQQAPFDHSNCQYPDRWSNPADGCDNSDPAVPECIKAISTQQAEQECIANFVKQHDQEAEAEPVATTPATAEQNIYSTCGGK